MTKWMLRQTSTNINKLARQTGISNVLGRILAVRGFNEASEINKFFKNDSLELHDAMNLLDIKKAISLTQKGIQNNKKFVIYGDYDADGIMSIVILFLTLNSLGANVEYYIPKREAEGYGLNKKAISSLKNKGVEYIIACDIGISAFEEVEYANSLGIEVIILDHHTVFFEDELNTLQRLPQANAIVNTKRVDCKYPFKHYCAAGICYRFSEALFKKMKKDWKELSEICLPFATIATVCDIVDLVGENRNIVKIGLPLITKSRNIGLNALLIATGLKDRKLDTFHIGFILGPCINATGRLKEANIAVDLFLTHDSVKAQKIASNLVELNKHRRNLTEQGLTIALQIIEEQKLDLNKIIVIYSKDILESISGIIAGRIKEKYNRPVIIISGNQETLHGSCRSIDIYNIFEGLSSCKHHLVSFGGHKMAAGLKIKKDKIIPFAKEINNVCKFNLDEIQTIFRIDCLLPPSKATLALAKELFFLAPYGKGNPIPLFAHKGLSIEKIALLGKEKQVMRITFREQNGANIEMLSFSGKQDLKNYIIEKFDEDFWKNLLAGRKINTIYIDIIYTIETNIYHNQEKMQLQIIDFRPAE